MLLLWFTGKRAQARHVLLGTILCFYSGYILYVVFPAAPPRLYLESLGMFTVTLRGGPIANFQQALIEMMPNQAARAAFPSLHSAVSCLSLVYAWRHCAGYFPILLVFVIGLLTSTVYLRHHWVVDLIAGAPWCRGCCGSPRASSAGGARPGAAVRAGSHTAHKLSQPPAPQRVRRARMSTCISSGRAFS